MGHSGLLLSVFIKGPEFVGQTKDKLSTTAAFRLVENSVRDRFDHWLAGSPKEADKLLSWAVERAEERQRRRKQKEISRKSATKKLRLPKASWPIVPTRDQKARNSSSSRGIPLAALRSKHATGNPRPSCLCAEKS